MIITSAGKSGENIDDQPRYPASFGPSSTQQCFGYEVSGVRLRFNEDVAPEDYEGNRMDLDRDGIGGEAEDEFAYHFAIGAMLPVNCLGELFADFIDPSLVSTPHW